MVRGYGVPGGGLLSFMAHLALRNKYGVGVNATDDKHLPFKYAWGCSNQVRFSFFSCNAYRLLVIFEIIALCLVVTPSNFFIVSSCAMCLPNSRYNIHFFMICAVPLI